MSYKEIKHKKIRSSALCVVNNKPLESLHIDRFMPDWDGHDTLCFRDMWGQLIMEIIARNKESLLDKDEGTISVIFTYKKTIIDPITGRPI